MNISRTPNDESVVAESTIAGAGTTDALSQLARQESGRVIALLARHFRDLDLADESVQDALVTAAETWPQQGVPSNPAAWLLTVARNRAIDRLRRAASARRRTLASAPELIATYSDAAAYADAAERTPLIIDSPGVADDHLRLMLLCCHPALDSDTQVALTLRLVGGLTTAEIAAAYLLPTPTLAARIVRAKRKIRDAGIPLSIPAALNERVGALLRVLYLIFNEGYLTHGSDVAVRVSLVDEAVRLTRTARVLLPDNAEVDGLLALELFSQARMATRLDAAGALVLLEDQDRTRWDLSLLAEANHYLMQALSRMQPGPYQLQALIAALHANARTAADTDWPGIEKHYRQLVSMTNSDVVRLNHAVALAMADGPHAGLALLETITGLSRYHLFHSTKAELFHRAGQGVAAAECFARALELTQNPAEQRHLALRMAAARASIRPGSA